MTPPIISKEHLPLNNKKANSGEDEGLNSSIEQLKCLLAPEFLKQQQPDSKLEKADILEMMTLNFQFTCCQSRLLQVCP
ncbi:hypothetical protein ABG768_003961 [Culter alburnus]|uniref:BHLH domain-containing protein n=1 Tax=Culter alburnus TaxID=194366 RepID=A0AAW2A2W4_CULAL